jgi:hypothetical protein
LPAVQAPNVESLAQLARTAEDHHGHDISKCHTHNRPQACLAERECTYQYAQRQTRQNEWNTAAPSSQLLLKLPALIRSLALLRLFLSHDCLCGGVDLVLINWHTNFSY